MTHAELRQIPDVPEISKALGETIQKLRDAIYPVVIKSDPNLTLNALTMILIGFATCTCDTQAEIDQVLDMVCLGIKKNSKNDYEQILKENE